MADWIFLMVSSVSIRAIRRSGLLQRGQIVSIANVLRSNWLHEIWCESGMSAGAAEVAVRLGRARIITAIVLAALAVVSPVLASRTK